MGRDFLLVFFVVFVFVCEMIGYIPRLQGSIRVPTWNQKIYIELLAARAFDGRAG